MKTLLRLTILSCGLALAVAAEAELRDPDPATVDAQLEALEGVFEGPDNVTPFGKFSMALLFQRQEDGGLHARSVQDENTWIDLRIHRDPTGESWQLTEGASMPGLGVQEYTLDLVGETDEGLVWEVRERPGFLRVVTHADAEGMRLLATLRGQTHVDFRLPRLSGERADAVAAELIRRAAGDFGDASR